MVRGNEQPSFKKVHKNVLVLDESPRRLHLMFAQAPFFPPMIFSIVSSVAFFLGVVRDLNFSCMFFSFLAVSMQNFACSKGRGSSNECCHPHLAPTHQALRTCTKMFPFWMDRREGFMRNSCNRTYNEFFDCVFRRVLLGRGRNNVQHRKKLFSL